MLPSSRVKQGVRLSVIIGLILGGALLHQQYVQSPPALLQSDESEVSQVLALSSPTASPIAPVSPTTTVAGVTVQIDPRTGRLRPPTNQQKQALAAAFRQQFSQPSPQAAFSHGNGMLSIVVGQSQLNFSLAQVNPQGEVEVSCLTGLEETATQLEEGVPSPLASFIEEE